MDSSSDHSDFEICLDDYKPIAWSWTLMLFEKVNNLIDLHFKVTPLEIDRLKNCSKETGANYNLLLSIRYIIVNNKYFRKPKVEAVKSHFECANILDDTSVDKFYQCHIFSPCTIYRIISKTSRFRSLPTKKRDLLYHPVSEIKLHSNRIQSNAENFEARLYKFLKYNDIEFETEEELKARGERLTPDVLFKEPVWFIVNGEEFHVRWMDAKNLTFFGKRSGFLRKKIIQQTKKYTSKYGMGALIFSGGYVEGAYINGAYLFAGESFGF